jgi:glycosyltransferase involved in cell wall biosynthesis
VIGKMNILIACPNPPWKIGGIEKIISEVGQELSKNHKVDILTYGKTDSIKQWNGMKIIQVKKSLFPFNFHMYNKIKSMNNKYDIFHVHNFSTTLPLEIYCKLKKKSIIYSPHFHPVGSNKIFFFIKPIYDLLFNRVLFKTAARIICVSNIERNYILKKFNVDEKKIEVIPNGVNLKKIRNENKIDVDKKIILYVGRLEKYKNVEVGIQALKYLDDEFKLVIIGNGKYEQHLKNIVNDNKLQERVEFIGKVSNKKLYQWLNSADLVYNFSSIEAFGITVIEGLAAGNRVLVNKEMGLGELSYLFENVDSIDIHQMSFYEIAESITQSLCKTFVKEKAIEEYDWINISRKYENIYNELIKDDVT